MSTKPLVSKDPFTVLLQIEQHCKTNACPLPGQHDLARTWQGIGFISANKYFVAPLAEVKEVLTVPTVTPLPAGADWFMGFANLRGRLLPITDLENFVSGRPQSLSPLSRVVVVNFEQTNVGFLVQQVLGVQRFSQTSMKPKEIPIGDEETANAKSSSSSKDLDIDPKFIPFLQGEFSDQLVKWHVLSLESLSQMAQFYHVVKESEA